VHAFLGEGAEEDRECGHKGFAFTGSHFGDFARVEHHAADELHVVVGHVPGDFVAASHPFVFPDGFVAVDRDEIVPFYSQAAVEVGRGDFNGLVGRESSGGLAHGGEDNGEMLVELFLQSVEDMLFMLVDFVPEGLAFVERKILDLSLEFGHGILVVACGCGDVVAYSLDFATQLVVGQIFESGADGVDFIDGGLDFLEVALRLVAENLA